jgi:hypothetical protein
VRVQKFYIDFGEWSNAEGIYDFGVDYAFDDLHALSGVEA